MPLPRSFKTDESFLEKIAIGATGTRRVFEDLERYQHSPIELERGSMSFKIWKAVKIKRIRVPDILCLRCGHRVESRAKTKMEISMSHSVAIAERGWNFGLGDDDQIAFVYCEKAGEGPLDWVASPVVQYVKVASLRRAWGEGQAKPERPKGAQEGFEIRVIWPSAVASAAGTVEMVEPSHIRYRRDEDQRAVTIRLDRQGARLIPLVRTGDHISRNQVIASVVPVTSAFPCERVVGVETYTRLANSTSHSDRYTAVKALRYFQEPRATEVLVERVRDDREHIYVRVDAAAGLMRQQHGLGHAFLADTLQDTYLENRLEAAIVLGEVGTPEAVQLLISEVRNPNQHPEIRAGAAWSLGEAGRAEALPALVESFTAIDLVIKVEAARALAKLARKHLNAILGTLPISSDVERPGIAWALSKAGGFRIDDLLPAMVDLDTRQWVSYIVGTQRPEAFLPEVENLRTHDAEVYFAVTLLWKIMTSWIYGLEEY